MACARSNLLELQESSRQPNWSTGLPGPGPLSNPTIRHHKRFTESIQGDIGASGHSWFSDTVDDEDRSSSINADLYESSDHATDAAEPFDDYSPLLAASPITDATKHPHVKASWLTGLSSPQVTCASSKPLQSNVKDRTYITLLALAVFSTVFSGIYLAIAVIRPGYRDLILQSDDGRISYSNAKLIFALIGKLVELAFVTVFVAFVGQAISTKAFNKAHGVTLAEILMRGWIVQPGQMLVQPPLFKSAMRSLIGILSAIAALSALLYTTAVSALVVPQLSTFQINKSLLAVAGQEFGDMNALLYECDPLGTTAKYITCIEPKLSAQSLYDFSTWLSAWAETANNTASSSDLRYRPSPFSILSSNISVAGQWIEISNMTEASNSFDRTINNVSIAMPHAAVVDSSLNKHNSMSRPDRKGKIDQSLGSYDAQASVASGAINVLCASATREELAPLVYETWPHANTSLDFANWYEYASIAGYVPSYGPGEWLNRTTLDQIFGFGPLFGQRRPPVFPRFPIPYNTIINDTGAYAPLPYRDALYVLGGLADGFCLCQMKAYRTSACSTEYHATSLQSLLSVQCEDPNDTLQFEKTKMNRDNISASATISLPWMDLANAWAASITLGAGITRENTTIARLLTEFFPSERSLNLKMPSTAEALAVLAASTLMQATRNAPMTQLTDSAPGTKFPFNETFAARITSMQYFSGPSNGYEDLLYIVLAALFAESLLVLAWLTINRKLVTDFSNPANLFCLSINSPPNPLFAGSCGGGPEDEQLLKKWNIDVDREHVYIRNSKGYMQELAEYKANEGEVGESTGVEDGPIARACATLSQKKSLF
ncbi:MAG: hypothetical protein Q9159_007060 [Coniocarpon cinnabarinum]